MWRLLLAATLSFEGPFSVAVLGGRGAGFWDVARDHFGAIRRCRLRRSRGQVIEAVADRKAAVGVLPLPLAG